MSAVFAAGLILLAAAAAADLAAGARWPRLMSVPYLLGAAGSGCLAAAGAGVLAGQSARLAVSGWLGSGTLSTQTRGLVADRLSGLFLLISFVAATGVSLAFANWAARPATVGRDGTGHARAGRTLAGRRGLGASYALALGAVAVIMTATDAFTALFAWEALTVAFYLLAGFERGRRGRPEGAFITLVFGRVSGAALLVGLLLLAARSHSLSLASFTHVGGGTARDAAETLLFAGFTIKVGLVPFQVWMPRGYPAAPGPARAIMAGVAVNVGFYGLWRSLELFGGAPAWLTGLLLVLAAMTALLGIAHAAVQQGLQRVIAYSSVENAGLILAGFGVALVGAAVHDRRLVAAGLLAATLQIVAHTAAKSLLFTSSAMIEAGSGASDLDALHGTARRLPWSGTGLAIGSLTLAGLPLTAGFASEWFLLESLMQQFRVPGLGYRLVLALAGAAVALTAGFAGVTFVRLVGFIVLGWRPARQGSAAQGAGDRAGEWRDYGWLGRTGLVILAAGCLATAALLPLVIRVIAAGLSPVVPSAVTSAALKSPWVVQPVFDGFSILSPSWLWIAMPSLLAIVVIVTRLVSGTRMTRVRRVPAWRSATAGVEGADCYTAYGFANPTRRVLAAVLHTRAEVRTLGPEYGEPASLLSGAGTDGTPADGSASGSRAQNGPAPEGPWPDSSPRSEPDASEPDASGPGIPAAGAHLGYSSDVIEVVETYVYRPLAQPLMMLVRAAKRLQSGRLSAYLAYMLIALIALIAVVVVLA
ncbi:MAG: proton-conducting transporter membrane subunit [Streptosporangiaceae bacterium]